MKWTGVLAKEKLSNILQRSEKKTGHYSAGFYMIKEIGKFIIKIEPITGRIYKIKLKE